MPPIPVVLIVGRPLLRHGLEATFRVHPAVVIRGVAESIDEIQAVVTRHRDAVIVSELSLGGAEAISIYKHIRACAPRARVVYITGTVGADALENALKGGGRALLSTTTSVADIVAVLERVARGDHVLLEQVLADAAATRAVVEAYAALSRNGHIATPDVLTTREREVLQGLAVGLTLPELADRIGVRQSTIRTHCLRLYARLGVNSRMGAVRRGVERGLVPEHVLREAVAAERAQRARASSAAAAAAARISPHDDS